MKRRLFIPLAAGLFGCTSGTTEPADAAMPLAKDALVIVDTGPPATPDVGVEMADSGTGGGFPDAIVFPDAQPITDRDRDGLPDAEDPAPDDPNALLYSDTFEESRVSWLFTSVGMEIDPVQSLLRVPRVEPLVREGWLGPRPQWFDVFIRGLIRVGQVGQSAVSGAGRLGLIGRVNQVAPDRYLLCGVDVRDNEVIISEHDGGAAGGVVLARAPIVLTRGRWLRMTFDIRGTSLRCTVEDTAINATSQAFTTGSAGFRSFDADWFEVYDR